MNNINEYLISDEEEPQPKSRKTKKSKTIQKSNFSQVKIFNIFEPKYQKWIRKHNSKIYNYFEKVFNHTFQNFFRFYW